MQLSTVKPSSLAPGLKPSRAMTVVDASSSDVGSFRLEHQTGNKDDERVWTSPMMIGSHMRVRSEKPMLILT